MNAIEIKDLTKHYNDFTLDHLTLTLPSGCIMGLVGENGAGKSTAMKLMLGMLRKDGGTVQLLGKDTDTALTEVKEDLGVVLDDGGLPECLNARQLGNVLRHSYRRWDQKRYEELLRQLNLPENKAFGAMSQGMRMKLLLTVALSHDPKFLILDEATNGLDPLVRDEITDLFMDFTKEESHSILISSHIVSDLEKMCDYIAFLHKGKLMLCEEKDVLRERYCVVQCDPKHLGDFPEGAVLGSRVSAYGAEAVIRREQLPRGMSAVPVDIEQLFVIMAKEEKK